MIRQTYTGIFSFLLLLLSIPVAQAQEQTVSESGPRFKAYEYEGEIYGTGELDPIDILDHYPSKRDLRRGRRRLAKFTRLRFNVHRVYPYAVKVNEILSDAQAVVETLPNDKAKKNYLKTREKALFDEYEDDLRRMTRTQGKVLIKLIHRQTGISTYSLIKDTKSSASAFFWQSVGRLFGVNLKAEFDRDEDIMIEAIVGELERGGYNIAYRKYNYVL